MQPRQFAQASSLNTVMRFVSTSLGIAVLATLVQRQAKIHYSHLAEQVTVFSPLGQLVTRLQSAFVARGADTNTARVAAIQETIRLVQRQGYMLALQDAFWLILAIIIAAFVATCFVQMRRNVAATPAVVRSDGVEEEEAARLEALLGV